MSVLCGWSIYKKKGFSFSAREFHQFSEYLNSLALKYTFVSRTVQYSTVQHPYFRSFKKKFPDFPAREDTAWGIPEIESLSNTKQRLCTGFSGQRNLINKSTQHFPPCVCKYTHNQIQ